MTSLVHRKSEWSDLAPLILKNRFKKLPDELCVGREFLCQCISFIFCISSSDCGTLLIPLEKCSILWAWKAEGRREWGAPDSHRHCVRNEYQYPALQNPQPSPEKCLDPQSPVKQIVQGLEESEVAWKKSLDTQRLRQLKWGLWVDWADLLLLRGIAGPECPPPLRQLA